MTTDLERKKRYQNYYGYHDIAPLHRDIYDLIEDSVGSLADGTYNIRVGKRIISNAASNTPAKAASPDRMTFSGASGDRSFLNYTKGDNTGILMQGGECYALDLTYTSGSNILWGYGSTTASHTNSGNVESTRLSSSTGLVQRNPSGATLGTWDGTNRNRFYKIIRQDGSNYLLRKSSADNIVRLVWVQDNAFSLGLIRYPWVATNASVGAVARIVHARLGAAWRTNDPLRTATIGAVSSGQTFSILADGFWARNIPMVSGQTVDWCFRYTDDNNYVAVRLAPSDAGVNPNTAKLVKKVAGLTTELGSVSRTLTPATTYEIKVRAEGSSITAWAALTRIGDVTDAFNSGIAGGKIINGTITSGRDYPATVTHLLKQQLEALAL